jgi:hypothetical protein
MYPQSSLAGGAKWFFFLAVLVSAAFLALGAELSKAIWLSRPIAGELANQIAAQTETQRKRDEIEIEKSQKLAAQEIQAQTARDAETLAFQQNIHAAMVFGAQLIAILIGLGLFVASVFVGIGLNRYLTANAQAKQTHPVNGRLIVKIEQLNRQIDILQKRVTAMEQRQNHRAKEALKDTVREWPDEAEDYLSRLPPTWAG